MSYAHETPLREELRAEYLKHQVRADRVAKQFGDATPPPLAGEGLPQYRRRLLEPLQKHSAAWKGVSLHRADESLLRVAETQILADAQREATAPTNLRPGQLVERIEIDETGRKIRKFYGDPEACWGPFKQPVRIVTKWKT